jgi:hypothetical protein
MSKDASELEDLLHSIFLLFKSDFCNTLAQVEIQSQAIILGTINSPSSTIIKWFMSKVQSAIFHTRSAFKTWLEKRFLNNVKKGMLPFF